MAHTFCRWSLKILLMISLKIQNGWLRLKQLINDNETGEHEIALLMPYARKQISKSDDIWLYKIQCMRLQECQFTKLVYVSIWNKFEVLKKDLLNILDCLVITYHNGILIKTFWFPFVMKAERTREKKVIERGLLKEAFSWCCFVTTER